MRKNERDSLILKVIIVILIILILIVLLNGFFSRNKFDKTINFYVVGQEELTVNLGDNYQDAGIVANKNGVNLIDEVVIEGNVDTSKIGEYTITYSLTDENGNTKKIKRIVKVMAADTFSLNGDSEVYLLLNGNYQEKGAVAYLNNVDYSNQIQIESNLNVHQEGIYIVKYTFEKTNQVLERKIYVNDFSEYFKLEYDNLKTNESVTINITSDVNKIAKYILPNNEEKKDANITYKILENGEYKFIIFDKYDNQYTKVVNIDNIDRILPVASCNAVYNGKTTIVNVNSDKTIKRYIYNGIESTMNNYTFNNKVDNINIDLYDEAGNKTNINCVSTVYTDKLEIHFIASGYYDDAILIRTIDKTVLIDSGRYDCRKKVTPYLKELGVTKIDAMIGSHLHNDHVAAQADILANFSVEEIYYPDDITTCARRGTCVSKDQENIVSALKKYNKTPVVVSIPTTLQIGEMSIYFLAPHNLTSSQNNNSFIFILKFRNNTFMFTGDAGGGTMNLTKLKNNAGKVGVSLDVDLLKYPHHGNQSLDTDFLSTLSPKYVIVPNYKASKYPNSTNKNKVKKAGATMYRQSDANNGNILVMSDGNQIEVIMGVKATNYKR